jgi:glycosyltransferase involved in cell wall biosynthesis
MPQLSVVMPTRNRSGRLRVAVESVLGQSIRDLELIVVDDGSDDDTPSVLAELTGRDPRVRSIRIGPPGGGAPAARNKGIDAAQGDYIAFLDDDDVWLPHKAEQQLAFLREHPGFGAVSSYFVLEDPSRRREFAVRGPASCSERDLLWENFLGSASLCMWRRNVFVDEPRFDTTFRSCQDWDVWMQCARQARIGIVTTPLCRYVVHDEVRITGNVEARVAGREAFVRKYSAEMTDACRQFHEARLYLLAANGESPRSTLRHARRFSPTARWIVASSSLAGRVGWLLRDPGLGMRWLQWRVRAADA